MPTVFFCTEKNSCKRKKLLSSIIIKELQLGIKAITRCVCLSKASSLKGKFVVLK